MGWLRSIVREVFGLFVDDGSLAIALLAWIIGGVAVIRMLSLGHWSGPVFFAGIALVLAENVLRASRRMG